MVKLPYLVIPSVFVVLTAFSLRDFAYGQDPSITANDRTDCYPEAESQYSNFSKDACLARNCLFDDNATTIVRRCYLRPDYGYHLLQTVQQTNTGFRFYLSRNQSIMSPFPEPIENVILEVQYYTNEIIRFKLYDADHQRYEVRLAR